MSDGLAHLDPRGHATATWQVQRIGLPSLRRRCPDCTTNIAAVTGKFRVNANGRLLDVWLLIRCAHCGHNARIKVHHRTNVTSFAPETLRGYMNNNPDLVVTALLDPLTARTGHYSLDWIDAWDLTTPNPEPSLNQQTIVHVTFDVPAPIRPARLIAQGLNLSRGEVEHMIASGHITSETRLTRKTSTSFTFLITPNLS